jgi:hypothetical protein
VKERSRPAQNLQVPARKQLPCCLRQWLVIATVFVLSFGPAAPSLLAAPAPAKAGPKTSPDSGGLQVEPALEIESGSGDCDLHSARGQIKHMIYLQFDNVHFTRDNPNVPSDLEQMPHLLNFILNNGVLSSNHHTPLISHTADDIITALTGVYGDRHGIPVANSFGYFNPPGSAFVDSFSSSFTYWTDPLNSSTDTTPIMLAADGKDAPAPWVPYTRAGCNVGSVSIANMELENVGSDVNTVFGPTSPQAAEAKANRTKAIADFEGISIHCAAGNALCSTANGGEPDVLLQEPGGYAGFNGLFGHAFVAPQISPSGPLTDLGGVVITDGNGNNGFPGFGGITASQSLGYVAAMQEHGVPITFAYISDAHDDHVNDTAFGPGQAGYVAQLASYDEAFADFFARLKGDGIDQHNTLFVITADENDHFAGGPPNPTTCDGVTIPCTYSKIGEIDSNIADMLAKQDPSIANVPFDIHFDMAPTFYVQGQPAPGDPTARKFERAASRLTAVSPITGNTDQLTRYLADPVEEKLLHMVTADPKRTPTFTMFGDPDYFFLTSGPDAVEDAGFAWNHGGVAPEINNTWLGLVGPGVQVKGVDDETWSDHTDIRPTMLVLAGLADDYSHEGRALVEDFQDWALPVGVSNSGVEFTDLAQAYKKINAPVGELGLASLRISTKALGGDDSKYTDLENKLSVITSSRDILADQMSELLEGAEFSKKPISAQGVKTLLQESEELLEYVEALANH